MNDLKILHSLADLKPDSMVEMLSKADITISKSSLYTKMKNNESFFKNKDLIDLSKALQSPEYIQIIENMKQVHSFLTHFLSLNNEDVIDEVQDTPDILSDDKVFIRTLPLELFFDNDLNLDDNSTDEVINENQDDDLGLEDELTDQLDLDNPEIANTPGDIDDLLGIDNSDAKSNNNTDDMFSDIGI